MQCCVEALGLDQVELVEGPIAEKPVDRVDEMSDTSRDIPVLHIGSDATSMRAARTDYFVSPLFDEIACIEEENIVLLQKERVYVVVLEKKEEAEPVGMTLDSLSDSRIMVLRINDGLMRRYNEVNPKCSVQHGDFLLRVNECSANSEEMVKELKKSGVSKLTFRRPRIWEISVSRVTAPLGLVLGHKSSALGVLVKEVCGGSMADFNSVNPAQRVQAGDIIIACNGVEYNADHILNAVQNEHFLRLKVLR